MEDSGDCCLPQPHFFPHCPWSHQFEDRPSPSQSTFGGDCFLRLEHLTDSSSSFDFPSKPVYRNLKQEQDHTHEVHCCRERSTAAWNIIEEYLMPFAEREKYAIPRSCRLHPDNDLFRDQEEKKINVDVNEWRCGYCKKSFVSEKFLDQHLDSRHRRLLNIKLAHSCFPVSGGPSTIRLHEEEVAVKRANQNSVKSVPKELFMNQFCEAHTCSGEIKPFSRGGRKQPSVLLYLTMSILTLMLLPLFYVIVCLHHIHSPEAKANNKVSKESKIILTGALTTPKVEHVIFFFHSEALGLIWKQELETSNRIETPFDFHGNQLFLPGLM